MKAFCNLVYTNTNRNLCFTQNHMYNVFRKYCECSDKEYPSDMTHYLIMDVDMRLDSQILEIVNLKKQGAKVILMTFDPANFRRIDVFNHYKMLDKIIVFDEQFKNRFNVKTFVSDYFFNQDVFPINTNKVLSKEVCIFGNMSHGRNNDFNLPRIDLDSKIQTYSDLYSEVQNYNGVAVYDTGLNEERNIVVHYNKAKGPETLMTGRNAYCQSGIKTKRYDRFLKKYEDIPNVKEIDFSQEEIWKINELTIRELLYECEIV